MTLWDRNKDRHDFIFYIRPEPGQVNLNETLAERNRTFGVNHLKKAETRKQITDPAITSGVNSWSKGGT